VDVLVCVGEREGPLVDLAGNLAKSPMKGVAVRVADDGARRQSNDSESFNRRKASSCGIANRDIRRAMLTRRP
jgi:hypothetical protein